MTAEWANVIVGSIATTAGIVAVLVAWFQLRNLNYTLKINGLLTILQLETDLASRKQRVDALNRELTLLGANPKASKAKLVAAADEWDAAMENWINGADRLAFCIVKGYVSEKDWRCEYRNYFYRLMCDHPKFFGPGSPYANIIELNSKWQRS